MTTTPTATSVEARFDTAVATVRSRGVHVALNVMTCCRSCTDYPDLGLTAEAKGTPVAWHYGGQGRQLVWKNDRPFFLEEEDDECRCTEDILGEDEDGEEYVFLDGEECDLCRYGAHFRASRPAGRLHFQHESDAAPVVRDAFTEQGFTVEWDGTTTQTVQVLFAGADQ